jgi:hypothetical protein
MLRIVLSEPQFIERCANFRMFPVVVLSPQWLEVRVVHRFLELGLISEIKADQRPDVIDVPAMLCPIIPRHSVSELGLDMRLELLDRAAQSPFQGTKVPGFFGRFNWDLSAVLTRPRISTPSL